LPHDLHKAGRAATSWRRGRRPGRPVHILEPPALPGVTCPTRPTAAGREAMSWWRRPGRLRPLRPWN